MQLTRAQKSNPNSNPNCIRSKYAIDNKATRKKQQTNKYETNEGHEPTDLENTPV